MTELIVHVRDAQTLRTRSRELRERSHANRARARALLSAHVRLGGQFRTSDDRSRFYFEVPCRLSNLRLVRAMFGAWLERTTASRGERFEIALAVHEACANAIEHPEHSMRKVFELSAGRFGQTIWLTVHDHGQWRVERPGQLRGRGLELIRELMDFIDIQPSDLGTTVLMSRRIGRPAPEREADRLLLPLRVD